MGQWHRPAFDNVEKARIRWKRDRFVACRILTNSKVYQRMPKTELYTGARLQAAEKPPWELGWATEWMALSYIRRANQEVIWSGNQTIFSKNLQQWAQGFVDSRGTSKVIKTIDG